MSPAHHIEQILRREIGLEPTSIGHSAISAALRVRMERCAVDSVADYWLLLQRSPEEMRELIESVVVSETWFFRDIEPFAALARRVRRDGVWSHRRSPVRILSVPCATGEEPYSIAMTLLDTGLPPEAFQITAVDVSARAVAYARRAVYGRNSFRTNDLNFRTRYFQPVENGHALSNAVRERVQFREGNLLGFDFANESGAYDFIFCRNVLIYFDGAAQDRAAAELSRLLAPDGLLFVGHAEVPLVVARGFATAEEPAAFACCKRTATARKPVTPVRRTPTRAPAPLPPRCVTKPTQWQPPQTLRREISAPKGQNIDLQKASELADRGALREAAEICVAHLREFPESAPAHYLLGLTQEALGDERKAMEHYRKAIYLDPGHGEALVQLSFCLERHGDGGGARRLRERASRLSHTPGRTRA